MSRATDAMSKPADTTDFGHEALAAADALESLIDAAASQVKELAEKLDEAEGRIHDLEAQLEEKDERIAELEAELAERSAA